MIKITEPKVSKTEQKNAPVAVNNVNRPTLKKEIPLMTLITEAVRVISKALKALFISLPTFQQQKDEEWIDHEIEKGLVSYSAQYSDAIEVFR